MPTLFDSAQFGAIHLKNRIVLAPLTRSRASAGRVPNDLMCDYYVQRSSAGLLLTEATAISPMAVGYLDTPGIWSDEQTEGWKKIVHALHENNSAVVCQLWHVGRISHPAFLDGQLPLSASAIAPLGEARISRTEKTPFVAPRALESSEIPQIIEEYRIAALNAQKAGFDGVEIHGANGYLPDQFLRDGTNQRTDDWGGSIENRARFLLAATDAAISVWGADKVGVHLSPRNMEGSGAIDSNPAAIFGYVAKELGKRKIAFLFTREGTSGARFTPMMKKEFGGAVIANEQFTVEQAQAVLQNGEADAVSWGKLFLANPDLPRRFHENLPMNEPNPATFYGYSAENPAEGYTDYPFADDAEIKEETA